MAQDGNSLELALLKEVLDSHTHHLSPVLYCPPRKEVRLGLRRSVSVLVLLLWEIQLPGGQRCHGTNPDGQKMGVPKSMILSEACSLVGTSPRDAVIGRHCVYKQIGADWSKVTSIDLIGDKKEI